MKIRFILSLLIGFILQGCGITKNIADHDYSYETNFKQFHNFNFVKCENDTSEICNEIQATIQKQMEIRGYKLDQTNADIYIGYTLIPNKVMYKAYKQPSMNRWVNKYDTNDTYKTEKFSFHNGMIMVSIIQAKNNKLIWRGFSTNISDKRKEKYNMDYYYSNAVRNIFKEYTLFASN